jgi:hypothetical protein
MNVRQVNTKEGPKILVMRPRSRNRHFPPDHDRPARIVDGKGRVLPFTEPPPPPPTPRDDAAGRAFIENLDSDLRAVGAKK